MHITGIDASAAYIRVLILGAGMAGTVIKYAIPSSGDLDIDFSDLVRLAASGMCSISANDANGTIIGSTYTMNWTQKGLINPAQDTMRPTPTIKCNNTPAYGSWGRFYTTPPLKIYPSFLGSQGAIKLEVYTGANCGYQLLVGSSWGAIITLNSGVNSIELTPNTQRIRLYDLAASGAVDNTAILGEIGMAEKSTEKEYVMLRWTSRYGVTKVACWERRNVKFSTDKSLEILRIDNQYDTRKGYVESFTACLEGLDAYDYWYYADIITSSKVELLEGINSYRVDVTTKDYTIPNTSAGKPGKLEVNINFRKYDTL